MTTHQIRFSLPNIDDSEEVQTWFYAMSDAGRMFDPNTDPADALTEDVINGVTQTNPMFSQEEVTLLRSFMADLFEHHGDRVNEFAQNAQPWNTPA